MAISTILKKLSFATAGAVLLTLGIGKTVQAGTFTFNTSDSQFTPGVDNQGWWSATLGDKDSNDNYFTGYSYATNDEFNEPIALHWLRNFFTFDLSSFLTQETIVSARLEVQRFQGSNNAYTLGLFDVSTDAATLNENNRKSQEIFDDLGTGKSYGAFEVSPFSEADEILSFTLNSAAITDINAARGGFFSIGGTLLNLNNLGSLFSYSSGAGVQRLVIETAPKSTSVPEPTSVLGLLSVAAFGAGAAVKRKQQQNS